MCELDVNVKGKVICGNDYKIVSVKMKEKNYIQLFLYARKGNVLARIIITVRDM